jgi:hypothetical protein
MYEITYLFMSVRIYLISHLFLVSLLSFILLFFFSLVSLFLKSNGSRLTRSPCCVSVYLPYQLFQALTNLYETSSYVYHGT